MSSTEPLIITPDQVTAAGEAISVTAPQYVTNGIVNGGSIYPSAAAAAAAAAAGNFLIIQTSGHGNAAQMVATPHVAATTHHHPSVVATHAATTHQPPAVAHQGTPTTKSKKRRKDDPGYVPQKRVRSEPFPAPAPAGMGKSALPSTTTLESANTDSEQRAIRNSYVTQDGRHVCGECGNALATSWGLDAHIKSVHGKKGFNCQFCDKAFGRKDHLVNHTKSMHTGVKECSQCGAQCSGKDGLTKHMSDHHPVVPSLFHQCSDCGKSYPSESACKIHIGQEHTVVSCQDCGHLCVGTEGLKRHVARDHQRAGTTATVTRQPPVAHAATSAAAAAAAAAAAVQQQQQQQQQEQQKRRLKIEVVFKCEYCAGTFSQQSSLNQHIRSFHMELQCVVCGSALVGSEAMGAHVQDAHPPRKLVLAATGELVFHCDICEGNFRKGHAYDEHFLHDHVLCKVGNELVKPDLTPIPSNGAAAATVVGRAAATGKVVSTTALSTHQGNVNIVYQCEHCDSLFTDHASLTKHMDSTHPETFALPTEPLPPSCLTEFESNPPAGGSVATTTTAVPATTSAATAATQQQNGNTILYQCLSCNELFVDAASLQTHTEQQHPSSNGLQGIKRDPVVVKRTAAAAGGSSTAANGGIIEPENIDSKYQLLMLGGNSGGAVATGSSGTGVPVTSSSSSANAD